MDTYALTRLQDQHGAWHWRVLFRRRAKWHQRRFYDRDHGGDAGARKAARGWRDLQLAQVDTFTKLEFCQQRRGNNTSGVPGVHFLTSPRQPLGFWQAKISLAGKRASCRSFSVKEYTNDVAYAMAVEARQAMLARQVDEPYVYAAVAKRKSKPIAAATAAKRKRAGVTHPVSTQPSRGRTR
jgi:hypothetical protein